MRVKIIRILLFWFFLPFVILRAIGRQVIATISSKEKIAGKIDPKEMDELLNTDISTENIL